MLILDGVDSLSVFFFFLLRKLKKAETGSKQNKTYGKSSTPSRINIFTEKQNKLYDDGMDDRNNSPP